MDEETKQTKITDDFEEEDKVETANNFYKFEGTGDTIIGILKRFDESTYGKVPVLETNDGEISIGNYSALTGKLTEEDIDKKVKIVYNGEIKSEKSGRYYKDFTVFKK